MKIRLYAKSNSIIMISLITVILAISLSFQDYCHAHNNEYPSTASIELMDGSIYELKELDIRKSLPTAQFYQLYSNYKTESFLLRLPDKTYGYYFHLWFKLTEIETITMRENHESVIVKLRDGSLFEGAIKTNYVGEGYIDYFTGVIQIEGYPADFGIDTYKVDSIFFLIDSNGEVIATVKNSDGKTTTGIKEPKFEMERGDSRAGRTHANDIGLKVGNNTIRIPVPDILSIAPIDEDAHIYTITLRNGKELRGEKPSFTVYGKTLAYGREVIFDGSFYLNLKSIYFNEKISRKVKKAVEEPKVISPLINQTISNVVTQNTQDNVTKSLLPSFNLPLTGQNEVRIKNPNNFEVTAGIRSGNKGKDLVVLINGVNSVYIPNGKYNIYFVYSNKPDALFQGDDFILNNNGIEIQIVKVTNGNYGIKQVK